MYLLGLSSNLWQGINDRGLDLIVGEGVYEQLAHGARAGISWLGAEYAACTSVAAFGNCLPEGLQLNNGGRNSFCLERLSLFLSNCGFDAAGQRESVRSAFLQSPSVTLGVEAKLSTVTCETGGGGVLRSSFW